MPSVDICLYLPEMIESIHEHFRTLEPDYHPDSKEYAMLYQRSPEDLILDVLHGHDRSDLHDRFVNFMNDNGTYPLIRAELNDILSDYDVKLSDMIRLETAKNRMYILLEFYPKP